MTAVTFLRVRERLNKSGLQLELYVEPDGFRWDIARKPLRTRRVFPTIQAALEHADMYTQLWYEQSPGASQQRPTGQLETVLAQAASPQSSTRHPVPRDLMRRLAPRVQARRR